MAYEPDPLTVALHDAEACDVVGELGAAVSAAWRRLNAADVPSLDDRRL